MPILPHYRYVGLKMENTPLPPLRDDAHGVLAGGQTSFIQWGLGMGVYRDAEKTIAFHWGNNPGSISFCAMIMKTAKTPDTIATTVHSIHALAIEMNRFEQSIQQIAVCGRSPGIFSETQISDVDNGNYAFICSSSNK